MHRKSQGSGEIPNGRSGCSYLRNCRLRNISRHHTVCDRLRRQLGRPEVDRYGHRGPSDRERDPQYHAARIVRSTTQRDGATGLQALVDALRAAIHRTEYVRAVLQPGAAAAVLAMAADSGADLDGGKPGPCDRSSGDFLVRLGVAVCQHLHAQPFRAVWSQPGIRPPVRQGSGGCEISYADALSAGAPSALSELSAGFLGDPVDDGRPLAVRGGDDRLHPDRNPARRARSRCNVRRPVPPLPAARLDAASIAGPRAGRLNRRSAPRNAPRRCRQSRDAIALAMLPTAKTSVPVTSKERSSWLHPPLPRVPTTPKPARSTLRR